MGNKQSFFSGVNEVFLQLESDALAKEKMSKFVAAVKDSGLVLGEGRQYQQREPHLDVLNFHQEKTRRAGRPWEVADE